MRLEYYLRPVVIFFGLYLVLIFLFSSFLLKKDSYLPDADVLKSKKRFCGYVISYPLKSNKNYYFYFESDNHNLVVRSDIDFKFNLYEEICFEGEVKEPENYNPEGNFNWIDYLKRKNIYYEVKLKKILSRKDSPIIFYFSGKLRQEIKKNFKKRFSGDALAVINGIFLGEKSELSKTLRRAITNCGAMHILVASGFHVSYMFGIIFFAIRIIGFNFKNARFIAGVFVLLYVFLVGLNPPIVRSYIMLLFVLVSFALKKNTDVLHPIIVSAFVMLLINPLLIYDSSFLMSFVSIYGIVVGYLNYEKYINFSFFENIISFRYSKKLISFLNIIFSTMAVTFFAQIALLPVTLPMFYKIYPISLISNLILIPLAMIIITILMIWLPFSFWDQGDLVALILDKVVLGFINVSYFFSSLKFSSVYFYFPNSIFMIFFVIFILLILHLPILDFKKATLKAFIFFILIGLIVSYNWVEKKENDICFENYGTKGCIVFKNGKVYLINPVIDADKIANSVFYSKHKNIDYILISSKKGLRKNIIKELKEIFNIKDIYLPLWLCKEGEKCVFGDEKYDDFYVKFRKTFGYFNVYSEVNYCFDDECY
ncbi:MAG: ComEC/Rec2 family competence protein [Elusimicrobiota bacterium]